MTDNFGSKCLTVLLVNAVNLGQIMILRLHGPDVIAILTKSLSGIFSHSRIDEERFIVTIDDKRAHIVVVMAFAIMSALHGHKEVPATCCHDLQIGQPHIFQ